MTVNIEMVVGLPTKANLVRARDAKLLGLWPTTRWQGEDCQATEKVNSAKVEGAKRWAYGFQIMQE